MRPAFEAVAEDWELRRGPLRPERLAPVRERLSGAVLRRLFRMVDSMAAVGGALLGAGFAGDAALAYQAAGAVAPLVAGVLTTLAALDGMDGYAFSTRDPLWLQLARVWAAVAAGALVALLMAVVLPAGRPQEALAAGAGMALTLGLAHNWAWLRVRRWRRAGRLTPNIVVVGATDNAARLIESALATREVNVIGVFDDRAGRVGPSVHGVPVLGDTSALLEHRLLPFVDRIVITVTATAQARVGVLIQRLRVLPNTVTLFVDVEGEQERADALSAAHGVAPRPRLRRAPGRAARAGQARAGRGSRRAGAGGRRAGAAGDGDRGEARQPGPRAVPPAPPRLQQRGHHRLQVPLHAHGGVGRHGVAPGQRRRRPRDPRGPLHPLDQPR